MPMIEVMGSLASVIVAISLTMKNIRWLRWVNLIGSTLFCLYGFLIQAWPVFGLNAFTITINLYYLVQLTTTKDRFALMEVSPTDAVGTTLLGRFLETYGPDIARFQPQYPRKLPEDARVFFVLREVLPISLFVVRPDGKGNQEILIDYAVPAWRDYHNARFLYEDGLRAQIWPGTGTFFARAHVAAHARYLKKIGFTAPSGEETAWSWTLGDPRP